MTVMDLIEICISKEFQRKKVILLLILVTVLWGAEVRGCGGVTTEDSVNVIV